MLHHFSHLSTGLCGPTKLKVQTQYADTLATHFPRKTTIFDTAIFWCFFLFLWAKRGNVRIHHQRSMPPQAKTEKQRISWYFLGNVYYNAEGIAICICTFPKIQKQLTSAPFLPAGPPQPVPHCPPSPFARGTNIGCHRLQQHQPRRRGDCQEKTPKHVILSLLSSASFAHFVGVVENCSAVCARHALFTFFKRTCTSRRRAQS
jgi:hypothetical protein